MHSSLQSLGTHLRTQEELMPTIDRNSLHVSTTRPAVSERQEHVTTSAQEPVRATDAFDGQQGTGSPIGVSTARPFDIVLAQDASFDERIEAVKIKATEDGILAAQQGASSEVSFPRYGNAQDNELAHAYQVAFAQGYETVLAAPQPAITPITGPKEKYLALVATTYSDPVDESYRQAFVKGYETVRDGETPRLRGVAHTNDDLTNKKNTAYEEGYWDGAQGAKTIFGPTRPSSIREPQITDTMTPQEKYVELQTGQYRDPVQENYRMAFIVGYETVQGGETPRLRGVAYSNDDLTNKKNAAYEEGYWDGAQGARTVLGITPEPAPVVEAPDKQYREFLAVAFDDPIEEEYRKSYIIGFEAALVGRSIDHRQADAGFEGFDAGVGAGRWQRDINRQAIAAMSGTEARELMGVDDENPFEQEFRKGFRVGYDAVINGEDIITTRRDLGLGSPEEQELQDINDRGYDFGVDVARAHLANP